MPSLTGDRRAALPAERIRAGVAGRKWSMPATRRRKNPHLESAMPTLPRVVKIGCTHATPRFLTTGTAVCSRTSLARQQVDYKQLAAAISSRGFIHSVFGKVSE